MSEIRKHFAVVAVALAAAMMIEPAHGRETLVPLDECPKTGPHRACLPVEIFLSQEAVSRVLRLQIDKNQWTIKTYFITGRLSGGAVRPYRLKVSVSPHDVNHYNPWELGVLPYRGRSSRDRPIILTNRGPLEIATKALDTRAFEPNLTVIDEKRWTIAGDYEKTVYFHLQVSPRLRVWNKINGVCVSAREDKPILLTASNSGCRSFPPIDSTAFFAKPGNFERLVRIIPGLDNLRDGIISEEGDTIEFAHGYATVLRLRGTGYLYVMTGTTDPEG